jgi:uncharacterized membrane protein
MKIRTFLLLVGLIAIIAFVVLNWSTIMMPTTLSLGITTFQAPFGLLILSLMVLFTAVSLIFVLYSRASEYFKDRNHLMEMQTMQKLANNTEESRLIELRELLGTELNRQSELRVKSTATVMARLEQLDNDLRSTIKP